MNAIFEKYLATMDKCLKPLPASERADIVKEIKVSILEMESENVAAEQILEKLGNPKDLAKAYLADLLTNKSGFSKKQILTGCAFYSLLGFSGLFIMPCLFFLAPILIILAVCSPILGAIKMIDFIFNLGLPYIQSIQVFLGGVGLNPVVEFICSIPISVLVFLAGRGAWKLLIAYCKKVGKASRKISV